jgi:hypothetical protein
MQVTVQTVALKGSTAMLSNCCPALCASCCSLMQNISSKNRTVNFMKYVILSVHTVKTALMLCISRAKRVDTVAAAAFKKESAHVRCPQCARI